ncbi:MAG: glutamate racemase [Pseudomonadota bacterium]
MESAPHFPIGVFDSGVGGLSILQALRAELPAEDFVYVSDSGHAPYGERDPGHIVARSRAITQHLLDAHHIKLLVVACNTATAVAIHMLRTEFPDLPMVGVEPAIKPAVAQSQTGRVGVMATRGTLASAKFQALAASLGSAAEIVLQPCDGLAHAIEQGNAIKTEALCRDYTSAMGLFGSENGQIDTLVLGCTHYPFASEVLRGLVGPAVRLIDTGPPVAQQTHRLLLAAGKLRAEGAGHNRFFTTGSLEGLQTAAQRWLQTEVSVSPLE